MSENEVEVKVVVASTAARVEDYIAAVDEGKRPAHAAALQLVRLEAVDRKSTFTDSVPRRIAELQKEGVLARVLDEAGVTAALKARADDLAAKSAPAKADGETPAPAAPAVTEVPAAPSSVDMGTTSATPAPTASVDIKPSWKAGITRT